MVTPKPKQTEHKIKTSNKFPTNENISSKIGSKAKTTRVPKPTAKAKKSSPTSSSISLLSSSSSSSTSTSSPPSSSLSNQLGDIIFELWTQKFVGAIGNLDAVQLDAFLPNETFIRNVELYPNKLLDLKDRTLKVGSLTYIPYAVTNYVLAGTGNSDPIDANDTDLSVLWLGSESELMRTFCEVHNCHLRIKPYGPDNWGIVYDNETSSGLLGGIYTQHLEIAIGCIYDWYGNLTETSNTIARSSVTILGPAPALIPPWYTNIAPFSPQLWMFLLTTMVMCAITLYIVRINEARLKNFIKGKSQRINHSKFFRQSYLDIFALFLQQPTETISIKGFAFRFFMSVLLSAAITLENTYSGQLKSILTVPQYSEPVDTSDKWVQSNWKWAAPDIIWAETLWGSTLLKDKIIQERFHVHDHDTLYQLSFRYDYGLAIERLQSGTFSFGKYITPEAMNTKIVLKDNLYFDYTRAVSIRGWVLMPLFNKHVRKCMESGLFEQWERQIVEKFLDRKTQEMMMNTVIGYKSKDPPKPLIIGNIAGALFSLIFGYILATTAFLVEIFGCVVKTKLSKIKVTHR